MTLDTIAEVRVTFTDQSGGVVESFVSDKVDRLKYGELMANDSAVAEGTADFTLLNERPIGQVNHIDVLAAARFMLMTEGTGFVKHTSMYGAVRNVGTPAENVLAAYSINPVARFGGIVALPFVDEDAAYAIVGRSGKKLQAAVVSLGFTEDAERVLLEHAKNPPLVFRLNDADFDISTIDFQEGLNGYVLQDRIPPITVEDLELKAGQQPDKKALEDVIFGFNVADAKHSNAVVYCMPTETGVMAIGIGGGEGDRIEASYSAMERALTFLLRTYLEMPMAEIPDRIPVKLYCASDAFFPDVKALQATHPGEMMTAFSRIIGFPKPYQIPSEKVMDLADNDGLGIRNKMGRIVSHLDISVPLVLNPGGAKGEQRVLDYCADRGMSVVAPYRDGRAVRCFKHGPQSTFLVR